MPVLMLDSICMALIRFSTALRCEASSASAVDAKVRSRARVRAGARMEVSPRSRAQRSTRITAWTALGPGHSRRLRSAARAVRELLQKRPPERGDLLVLHGRARRVVVGLHAGFGQ